jgi:hypothetical protein
MRAGALMACLLLAAPPACAATASETAPAEAKPVAAFGDDHPDCFSWSDGCVICRKQPGGDVACSTPGIACLPVEPSCARATGR